MGKILAISVGKNRLVEVDALRGLAALAVVLFHFTTRFTELFSPDKLPTISFPTGYYGVNLFFVISGFVIFMTLEKTTRPMDFVVSRFSRLFPAYWVAILLTFTITHMLGLPGKLVDLASAVGNIIMIHGLLFRIPSVDGVYWTLEVELLFYCGMFLLYRFRSLHLIHHALITLLVLRLTYYGLERVFGIELSWTVSRFLILKYIPWFSLGISIYLMTSSRENDWRGAVLTSAIAIVSLLVVDSLFVASLAIFLGAAVFLAASGRATLLRHPILVWLGTISYPLYLLHENIGWSIQLRLGALAVPIDLTVVVALAISLVMATMLTYWVEQPCMRWIRNRYKSRLPKNAN